MRRYALVVFTDGRNEFLAQTVASAQAMLGPVFTDRIMVDDSGLIDNHDYLCSTYPQWRHVHSSERCGQAKAVRLGWQVAISMGATHVFHLEDDFTFNGPVDIDGLADLLDDAEPPLGQVFLQRQPWGDEVPAGGFMRIRPEEWTQSDGYVEEAHIFTWNPCLIPRRAIEVALGNARPLGELMLAEILTTAGYRFGCVGTIDDPPRVEHIGVYRASGWRA